MAAFNVPYFCSSSDSKTKCRFSCSYNTYTRDFNHAHSLTNLQWSPFSTSKDSLWAFINWTPYMVRVGETKTRIGPPKPFLKPTTTATMCISPCGWPYPSPPVPPFLFTQNPSTETILSAQCTVWLIKSGLQGLKGLLRSSSVTSNKDL